LGGSGFGDGDRDRAIRSGDAAGAKRVLRAPILALPVETGGYKCTKSAFADCGAGVPRGGEDRRIPFSVKDLAPRTKDFFSSQVYEVRDIAPKPRSCWIAGDHVVFPV